MHFVWKVAKFDGCFAARVLLLLIHRNVALSEISKFVQFRNKKIIGYSLSVTATFLFGWTTFLPVPIL